jgi:acetylornithine aminotransferase
MIEPIQGEGGVRVPSADYMRGVRALCDSHGCLLVLDEVQTGVGRTGKLFCYEHYRITPDIMTLAKGIAGGFPMGALVATDEVARAFVPGTHASTFGGNPLACAAAIAVIEEVLSDGFLMTVEAKGKYLRASLKDLAQRRPIIREARGIGLMQAIDLAVPAGEYAIFMLEGGVLVNCTSETVLRFLPPLVVTKAEIDRMIEVLDAVLGRSTGS